jgi:hypothetical protein
VRHWAGVLSGVFRGGSDGVGSVPGGFGFGCRCPAGCLRVPLAQGLVPLRFRCGSPSFAAPFAKREAGAAGARAPSDQ